MGQCQSIDNTVYAIDDTWFISGIIRVLFRLSESRSRNSVELKELQDIWIKLQSRPVSTTGGTNLSRTVKSFLRTRYGGSFAIQGYANFFTVVISRMRHTSFSEKCLLRLLDKLQTENYRHCRNMRRPDYVLERICE